VRASYLRTSTEVTPPPFQQLRELQPSALERQTVSSATAFVGALRHTHCVVSHRWLAPHAPDDATGSQLRAVREYLLANPAIEWVWYDFWCMPQGERTPAEKVEFVHMLQNINVLYLSLSVLLLLDLSYISRFWTQFEAWCSMQTLSSSGLRPASKGVERRCTVAPILGANSSLVESLLAMWGERSPQQAHDLLSKDDVTVTNLSDKEGQLPKILKLNETVRAVLSRAGGVVTTLRQASGLLSKATPRRRTVSLLPSSPRASVACRLPSRPSSIPSAMNSSSVSGCGAESWIRQGCDNPVAVLRQRAVQATALRQQAEAAEAEAKRAVEEARRSEAEIARELELAEREGCT